MSWKVRRSAVLAVTLALGAGAAGALPATAHRPQAPAPLAAPQGGAGAGWLTSWFGSDSNGRRNLSNVREREGSQLDPNGLLNPIKQLIESLTKGGGTLVP